MLALAVAAICVGPAVGSSTTFLGKYSGKVTEVVNGDAVTAGKIALAHMKEFPDYYVRLERMEAEAERELAGK